MNTPVQTHASPAPFVLASVLMSYPVEASFSQIAVLLADKDVVLPASLRSQLEGTLQPGALQDLQSEYIEIFDNGRDANPLCETEYDRRRPLAKGQELSDIAGFYRAFGFELDGEAESREMLDHAGIEMEFYALMLMKKLHLAETGDVQGVEIVGDGLRKFLQAHLGRFIRSISRRPGVEASVFYSQVFAWGAQLIDEECRREDLKVEFADWIDADNRLEEEMNCCPATEVKKG